MHKKQLGNIGEIIQKAIRFGVHCVPAEKGLSNYGQLVGIGPFVFDTNKHDTGISVHAYIKHPKTSKFYEIINGTYWYSESSYGHNKFKWEDGKWNEALTVALAAIVAETNDAESAYEARQDDISAKQDCEKQTVKAEFESIF